MESQRRGRARVLRHIRESSHFSKTMVLDGQWAVACHGQIWRPATDVYETDNTFTVKLEVAGMSEDDFDLSLADGKLSIRGMRHDPAPKVGYYQMEIPYGEFHVDIYVPMAVDVDNIQASYKNGFLLVTLPKEHRRFLNAGDKYE